MSWCFSAFTHALTFTADYGAGFACALFVGGLSRLVWRIAGVGVR